MGVTSFLSMRGERAGGKFFLISGKNLKLLSSWTNSPLDFLLYIFYKFFLKCISYLELILLLLEAKSILNDTLPFGLILNSCWGKEERERAKMRKGARDVRADKMKGV